MQMTLKSKYAVTALLDLMINAKDSRVSLNDIANRNHISMYFLEQVFIKLKKSGLVDSCRGPKGGYRLKKKANEIRIFDIINAVDENLDATFCKSKKNCYAGSECLTHHFWHNLSNEISRYLKSCTLNDLIMKSNKLIT